MEERNCTSAPEKERNRQVILKSWTTTIYLLNVAQNLCRWGERNWVKAISMKRCWKHKCIVEMIQKGEQEEWWMEGERREGIRMKWAMDVLYNFKHFGWNKAKGSFLNITYKFAWYLLNSQSHRSTHFSSFLTKRDAVITDKENVLKNMEI